MKAKFYFIYATRSLLRGGQRTLLAMSCIAVGVMTILAFQIVVAMYADTLKRSAQMLNGGDLTLHSESDGLTVAKLAVLDRLKAAGQISTYTAVAVAGANTRAPRGALHYVIFAVDPQTFPLANDLRFETPLQGQLTTLLSGNNVVVTNSLLRSLGLAVGDQFSVATDDGRTDQVKIVSVVSSSSILNQPTLLMDVHHFARLPSVVTSPLAFTWIYINVPDATEQNVTALADQIHTQLPFIEATTAQQAFLRNQQLLQNVHFFFEGIGLLALLMGGIGIINTMQVLLRQRRLEMAMLKTLGYRPCDLVLLFALEVSEVGLIGSIYGAVAGLGLSYFVRNVAENAFFLDLPFRIDGSLMLSSIATGLCTTLIFGLYPVIQASQVRPLAMLRDLPERPSRHSATWTVGLLLLSIGLFTLLAFNILHNSLISLAIVGGTTAILSLLTASFVGVAWLLSRLPMPGVLPRWYKGLLMLLTLLSIGLIFLSPTIGLLLSVIPLVSLGLYGLPQQVRYLVHLALTNIGRQKLRTATTLLVLFIGVFGVGAGVIYSSGIQNLIERFISSHLAFNALIFVPNMAQSVVEKQLDHLQGLKAYNVNVVAPMTITAVNGNPISPPDSLTAPSGSSFDGVIGYDLEVSKLPDVILAQGFQDNATGRNLQMADMGTNNALFPLSQSEAPLTLKRGDIVTVHGVLSSQTVRLTIVGFYINNGSQLPTTPILTDSSAVQTLSNRAPAYIDSLNLEPSFSESALQQLHSAVPIAVVVNLLDVVQTIDTFLSNILLLLETVAILTLFVGLLVMANAVALITLERRREIGIFKAIGYTSRQVLSLIILEYGILGFVSSLLATLLIGLSSSVVGLLLFHSVFNIAPAVLFIVIIATTLGCIGVASGIAWRAVHLCPIEVLRFE